MRATLFLLGIVSCAVSPLLAEASTIIDFESLASAGSDLVYPGPSYTEDGFTLANLTNSGTNAFACPQAGNSLFYTGSAALFNNFSDAVTQLTKVGGGAFDLNSIDLAEVSLTLYPGPVSVSFTGTKLDSSTVNQAFSLDGVFGFQTFVFPPSFTGVTSVTWVQQSQYHQFDNIVLNAVPEPSTLLLCLSAIVAIRLRHRKLAFHDRV